MAQTVANDMVNDKEKALKAAQNAKSKGGATIAEKIASEQERKANIQNAEQELAIWQAIASVPEARQQAYDEIVAADEARRAEENAPIVEAPLVETTEEVDDTPSLLDVVRTLYSKGKGVASKLFSMKFFDVAQTPKFMQDLGLRGDKFTIKYGVISRHFGKDGSHNLTESNWKQLPQAIQNPFAISKITDEEDSYRIYTNLQTEQGEFIVVGVDVKNAGREIEVNAISTAFGRRNDANLPMDEEVIYMSNKITPEQSSLLERPNFAQYPTEQELSISKDTTSSQNNNEIEDKNVQPTIGEQIQAAEAELKQVQAQYDEYSVLMKKELAEKEAKYAEMDSTIEAADDITNTEEDDDVLYRDGEYLNFKAKYNLVGAGVTAVIESQEDLLKLKNILGEEEYMLLQKDYSNPQIMGTSIPLRNIAVVFTEKSSDYELTWWHENTHIAYQKLKLEDKEECALAAFDWLKKGEYKRQAHYQTIINSYDQTEWAEEAIARLIEYTIENYGVERFLSSKFGGDEKISKLVTAIKNQLVYGKEEPTEHDILRRSRNVTGPQATDGRTNQNGAPNSWGRQDSQITSNRREGFGGDAKQVKDGISEDSIAERSGEGAVSDEGVTMASDPVSKSIGEPRYGRGKKMREYAERQRRFMVQKVQEIAQKLKLDNVEIVTDTSTLLVERSF